MTMTPEQALKVIKQYQTWRKGVTNARPYTPDELTKALATATKIMEGWIKSGEEMKDHIQITKREPKITKE